ncbi:hypothetical protein LINPERPRIM_LOCUS34067 [Linum perenne]
MGLRRTKAKDIADPKVRKRKSCWVSENPYDDDDFISFLKYAEDFIEVSSSSSDDDRNVLGCAGAVRSLDERPNGGRIRKGGKIRDSELTTKRRIQASTKERKDSAATKGKEKCEVDLNPISSKQFPKKVKQEMGICDTVCEKRSDGVRIGPLVWRQVIKKNEYGLCGGSEVRSVAQSEKTCRPNGGRIRQGGKDRDSHCIKERNIKGSSKERKDSAAAKGKEKCQAALNPISCKQFPKKVKQEMGVCNTVSEKRSDGVRIGPMVGTQIIKKNEDGLCGGSKVRGVGQIGNNSLENRYKEVTEKAGRLRSIPTRETKTSSQVTTKERKVLVPKVEKGCKAAAIHCKKLPDKVHDVVENIGSAKRHYEVGTSSHIVVKEEPQTWSGPDSDVIELDASMLPLGDDNPFLPTERRENADDGYDHAVMSNSEFRLKLMEILRQPYSDEEYNELLNEVSRPRQLQVDDQTPRSSKAKPQFGMSYLEQQKDFAKKLNEVHIDPESNHHRRETLNLLRGFFYWLQHHLKYGAFQPWTDQLCLQELPR